METLKIIIGDFASNWFINTGINQSLALFLKDALVIALTLIIAIISNYIVKKVIIRVLKKVVKNTTNTYDDIFLQKKVFHRLSHLAPILIIYFFSVIGFSDNDSLILIIQGISKIYLIVVIVITIDAFLNAIHEIYLTFEVSKYKTIKGYIQIIKIIINFIAGIIILSILLNKSPMYLIGGLGALTAVMMIVFKDVLTGLAASIQLSINDMLRPGDWISMNKYNVDGDVMEINLTTVKVKNFDNTISSVPTYTLITEPFQNWRGMVNAGRRRIKRSLFIDVKTIKFCDNDLYEKLKNTERTKEFSSQITNRIEADKDLTNLKLLIYYIEYFLNNNKNIDKEAIMFVRMLQPNDFGLPLEIYAFANTIVWKEYEIIQNDIFEHVIAICSLFELSIYQRPSANEQTR
ncbi:MAG: hypothetical protein A2X12_01410 [Bacteroidetes bacterium GWE2_29_8]|nr:MAG: hypothetical protein A2X12_01410 [Bacteroidetes bacterium GWE2_29_8]OFY23395.1 MAG: hypothetical protein A2X02_08825 [Bacteroidetes bacterium GWF2_29_10]